MTKIQTFSDGYGAGHAFPMWPQIIAASGFNVVNHSEVSISVPELLDLFYNFYNTEDRFIVQLPSMGRVIGIRMPAKEDPDLIARDVELIKNFKDKSLGNVEICTVLDMAQWSKQFSDRGHEVQPQPVVHARWLKQFFPDLIHDKIYQKIEQFGQWEPYYWDREQLWETIKNEVSLL